MKKVILAACAVFAFAFSNTADAQIQTPQPSPEATVMQKVGLADVSVNYSRPSMKGREIFGGLVPFGEMWRTGANGSTDIEFSKDIEFAGTAVEAGKYALYAKPNKSEWTVMLYKNTEHWGTPGKSFDESLVAAQTTVKPGKAGNTVETFTIGFGNISNNGAHLVMAWDDTQVEVPFTVDTKSAVQESIDKVMAGPNANDYFSAASFYFQEGLDLGKAHEWASTAVEMRPEAFWMSRLKSEIEAKQGNYKKAIKTAMTSKAAAEKAGNAQYVRFNETNIASWKKKK